MRRVIAKNPSKFTYHGTGTYIVGDGEVAVIDPGPDLPIAPGGARGRAAGPARCAAILVTHCHSDHSPLAAWLHETTGAPTVAFGPHRLNTDWVEDDTPDEPDAEEDRRTAAADGMAKVEESLDLAFEPDVRVADGDVAAAGDGLDAARRCTRPGTPATTCASSSTSSAALFTGDHIMGWSTTVITPPDGDMRDYFASLRAVHATCCRPSLWPTHGAPVTDVATVHRCVRRPTVASARRRCWPPCATAWR